mgnify:FL=1
MKEEELRRLEKGQKIKATIDGIKETVAETRNVISEKDNIGRGELYIRGETAYKIYLTPEIAVSVLNTICTKSEEEIKRLQKEFDAL